MNELLFEALSISDEVVNVSDKILNEIILQANNTNWENITNNGNNFTIKEYVFNNIKDFDIHLISIRLINFSNIDELAANQKLFVSGYNYNGSFMINIMFFILPCINGELYKEYCNGIIQHEVEHAYQISKSEGNFNDTFYRISNQLCNSNDDIENKIGTICYFLDKKEIDANANSLFSNLKAMKIKSFNDINRTQIVGEYQYIKDLMSQYVTDNNLIKIAPFFKMSANRFKKYIDSQEKYLRVKFGKVIQNYFNQVNSINIK